MTRSSYSPEDLHRILIEEATDYAIFLMDTSGVIQSWNRGGERLFGYEADEVVGKNFAILFTPEDIGAGIPQQEIDAARRFGRGEDRRWHNRKDGSLFFADGVTAALRDDAGALIGFSKIARDGTTNKIAEEQLGDSERRLRLTMESIEEYAIILLDEEGNIASWSSAAQDITGYRPEEIVGKHLSALYPPGEAGHAQAADELRRAAEEGKHEEEGIRVLKDGTTIWATVLTSVVRDDSGAVRGFVRVMRDVSAKKRHDQALLIQTGIARILAESDSFADAAPRILQHIGQTLGWACGNFWSPDHENGTIECSVSWTDAGRPYALGNVKSFAKGEGLPGRTWAKRAAEWIENVHEAKNFPRAAIAAREGFVSAFAFPVVLGEDVLGVFEFFSRSRSVPDDELIHTTEVAGSQIGQFIERRRAELTLRESEEKYRVVAETASDAIFTIDVSSTIRYVNPAVEKIFGYTPAELLGRNLDTLMPPHLRGDHHRGIARHVETGERHIPWTGVELPGLHKNGEEIPLELSFGEFGEGPRRLFSGFARDIRERRRAEEERSRLLAAEKTARRQAEVASERTAFLARASQLLASSLDYMTTLAELARISVPDIADWCAVDILSNDGSRLERLAVEHVDPAKVRLARELQERYPADLSAPHGIALVISEKQPVMYSALDEETLRSMTRDDEHFRIVSTLGLTSAMIVPLAVGERVFGTLTLVTAESGRVYGEQDLEFARDVAVRASMAIHNSILYRQAQEANRAKDEFLATVSHELRTPMTAIVGWARVLRLDTSPETLREAVAAIERSATSQAQLIDDILDVSRIRVGKLNVRFEPVNLADVISDAVGMIQMNADLKQVQVITQLDQSLPFVSGDGGRLQQVVLNLLSNAVKFTPSGGTVEVRLDRAGDRARITVRDTGQGVPNDFLPYVFERFRQAEASTRRTYGGLGLGMSIARHLVEIHGGTISVSSEGEGRGATFTVELPFATATSEQGDATVTRRLRTRAADEKASLEGLHLLVVEDDADTLAFTSHVLESQQATVHLASSVDEALPVLDTAVIDVVLADIAMPRRDGYDLLREVRNRDSELGRHLPVIAITASGAAGDRERALSAGFDDYLRKPFEPAVLVERVAELARTGRSAPRPR